MQLYEPILDAGPAPHSRRNHAGVPADQGLAGCAARLGIKVIDRSGLSALVPDWADLLSRAAEDNVYYAPHYALPLLQSVDRDRAVTFVTVWDRELLIALLPVVRRAVPVPGILTAGAAWDTEHTYCCTPLLDRDRLHDAAAGLVEALSSLGSGEWVIPNVHLNGTAIKALCAALHQRGAPWTATEPFKRAVLHKGMSFEDHMKSRVASKRRRELARNRRRLEELGEVRHCVVTTGDELDEALREFLSIEVSGWKGKRGTALACTSEDAAFARAVFGMNRAGSNCRIDMLLLDDVPIAVGLIVFSGRTGFTVKNAYDEEFSAYSVGLLLEVEVLKSFLTENWAATLDSGTSGNHVIDCLWPDSIEIADIVFSLASSTPRARLNSYMKLRSLRESTRSRLKAIIRRAEKPHLRTRT